MDTNINKDQLRVSRALHHAAFFCGYSVLVMLLITMETVQTFQELSLTASTLEQTATLRSAVEKRYQKRMVQKRDRRAQRMKKPIVKTIKKGPTIVVENPTTERTHQAAEPEVVQHSSSSSSSVQPEVVPAEPTPVLVPSQGFPAFEHTQFPIAQAARWGEMTSRTEWARDYTEMTEDDYIAIPRYNITDLMTPMANLLKSRNQNKDLITAKLFYSTRHFGAYDLDSGEYVSRHAGIDIKTPLGTPVYSTAGGRVHDVRENDSLGIHVIVEHRINGEQFYSIYGHLAGASVRTGQDVEPGTKLGTIGLTGNTSGAHLHFQVDRGTGAASHEPYVPAATPTVAEANKFTIHPVHFISQYNR